MVLHCRTLPKILPHVRRESGFQNPGSFCSQILESQALESGIQPKESRIPLTIGFRIKDPLTKAGIQYLESVIEGVESTIHECLGFLYIGRKISRTQNVQIKSQRYTWGVNGDASSRHRFERYARELLLARDILTGFQL